MKKIFLYSLCLLTIISCSGNKKKEHKEKATSAPIIQKDSFEKSVLIPSVISRKYPSLSFALYIPHQYGDGVKMPTLIFFDPHADGVFPLNKYRTLAEKFGVILIGSNNSKNGLNFDQTNSIVSSLIAEVKERFSADEKQISVCGFSGGAKVALVAGMTLQGISSLVYCGAGLPAQQISSLPPSLGFAGVRDLNYTEVMGTDEAIEGKKVSHGLIEWNGKHEWPDSISFKDAFYWIRFSAMNNKAASTDHELVNEFIKENEKAFKNPLQEWLRLKKMISFLNGVADISQYQSAHESLIKKKEFTAAVQNLHSDLETERKMKENYYACGGEKDLAWWKIELERLNKDKGPKEAMNQRLLGYISLMCFSISNSALKQGDNPTAEKTLAIYKLADPENPDQAYLKACLEARNNNSNEAIEALREAVRLGFKDKTKLMNEESFASIKELPEFRNLLNH